MRPPLDAAGYIFCRVHAEWGRLAGFTLTEEEINRSTERKHALLSKVADLARIPDHRRETFIGMAASAIGSAWIIGQLGVRTKGSAKLLDAYAKVLAARNAVAMLDDQDRALIDESRENSTSLT
jgi:hypothetical protein